MPLVPICDFMAGYGVKFIFTSTTYGIRGVLVWDIPL